MRRWIAITSMAAALAAVFTIQAEAGCGSCGTHAEAAKKACKADCTKPCCAKPAAAAQACKAKQACDKPCAMNRAQCKKACAAKCKASTCDVKRAKQCTAQTCGKPEAKAKAKADHDVAEINTSGLKVLLDSKAKVTVLDARTGKYDDGRRIPGAKGLAADASEEEIDKAIRKKSSLVVTYCSNLKCPASAMLAKRLKALGYHNVIEYPHGIDGWAKAGLPVKQAK